MKSPADHPKIAAIGMFDGVHLGHRHLLAYMAEQGRAYGLSSMAVTFPYHPLANIRPDKAPSLLTPSIDEKRGLLLSSGADRVLCLAFGRALQPLTAAQFMAYLHDRYNVMKIVVGYDHRFGSDRLSRLEDYRSAGKQAGVEVIGADEFTIPNNENNGRRLTVSSSTIRHALAEGDIETANAMLGRRFTIKGEVIAGNRLGRTIGFPTANLKIDPRQCMPKPGVYVLEARVETSSRRHLAICNIGHRPTVAQKFGQEYRVEAHLLDFDGELYGKKLRVSFIGRLRDEKKFPSIDLLSDQLKLDREAAIMISGDL